MVLGGDGKSTLRNNSRLALSSSAGTLVLASVRGDTGLNRPLIEIRIGILMLGCFLFKNATIVQTPFKISDRSQQQFERGEKNHLSCMLNCGIKSIM